MYEKNKWDELVIKAICLNNFFEITEVKDFQCVKNMHYDRGKYPLVSTLINGSDWQKLESLDEIKVDPSSEYLYIIKFSNQDNKKFVATVYDSDELWQDPEIIEIVPENI